MFVRHLFSSLIVTLAIGTTGCLDRDLRPLNPCTISGVSREVRIDNVDKVDLLFMVDNSGSMSQEQDSLNAELDNLVRTLASGERRAPDGTVLSTFPPVKDLRIGVISSDMGTSGVAVSGCDATGDDGVLLTQGDTTAPGCSATYPSYMTFRPEEDAGTENAFAADVTCVATLGTNGCGFEQQLDAVLKAVSRPDATIDGAPLTFQAGTTGHAGVANGDFLRPDSLLAIIMVTDEDDCSVSDPELFTMDGGPYAGPLNLRCSEPANQEAIRPTARFVQGLLQTRTDPGLLVFAAIVGVPTDLVAGPMESTDYARILADPRMQEVPDPDPTPPARPGEILTPSCDVPGRGIAFPPRRILGVAQGLEEAGANSVIQSICQESFAGALDAIINKIADQLGGACLPRALTRSATGLVTCDVVEVLPAEGDVTRCDQIADRGRMFRENTVDAEGVTHEVCVVGQVTGPGGDAGWFYDDASVPGSDVLERCEVTPQRISFTSGAEPRTGSIVRLECLQAAGGNDPVFDVPGSECRQTGACDNASPETQALFPFGGAGQPLTCEPVSNTCQPRCNNTSECPGGYVCYDVDGDDISFCVNPTCTTT